MIGLSAVVVFTVLLPLAVASAGPAGSEGEGADPVEGVLASVTDDQKARQRGEALSGQTPGRVAPGHVAEQRAGLPGRAHAQCGPEVASPEGVEAQTCVLAEGSDTWARTYYRNATGEELVAVLTLMAPAGRTVRMHCSVGAGDEPGSCETPHEPGGAGSAGQGKAEPQKAEPWKYTAVSEFAGPDDGPLLLRSGSNSAAPAAR
ncbi:hypothetical protein ACH4SP_13150 [Streptomyces sp. NPDC021093]|uniref:hypothetical protein n=1 Tax=Streptomyces sp. NPDC021093 TaxID=3365112 RepID=UPI0037B1E7FA